MSLAVAGEEHQVLMCRCHDEVSDKVVLPRRDSRDSLASAALRSVCICRDPLDVSEMCKRYRHIFFFYEISFIELIDCSRYLRASLVRPFFFDLHHLVSDDSHEFFLVSEQFVVISYFYEQLIIFIFYFFSFQTLQSCQPHIEYGLCLDFGKIESFHESLFRVVVALTDYLDYLIYVVERYSESFQDVSSCFGFAQVIFCSACQNFLLMLEIFEQHIIQ